MRHHKILDGFRFRFQELGSCLDALSPLAVLSRGYSIAYKLPRMLVLRSADQVRPGDQVRVRLSQGTIECGVIQTEWNEAIAEKDGKVGQEKKRPV